MNKLEAEYAAHLEDRRKAGEIAEYRFESVKILASRPKEGRDAWLTPDFAVWTLPDMELEYHDCKGFLEEDALQKLKAVSEKYPHRILIAKKRAKRDGGGWELTEV
jgi:hypothetical protein